MLVLLGPGHNAMNVIQAHGRGKGNGLTKLIANGFDHVTMLTAESDMDLVRSGVEFTKEVFQ